MLQKIPVPHLRQSHKTTCGAACLAMLLNYWGTMENEQVIWNACKSPRPNSKGEYTPTANLVSYVKSKGFQVFHKIAPIDFDARIQVVKDFLIKGLPVIVCQRISRNSPYGHFRVVIGYDKINFFVNDPLEDDGGKGIGFKDFLKLWEKTSDSEVIGGDYFVLIPAN